MFPPSRIVCLTEETVETLYLLGEQDRIVGISGYVVRPPQARREKPRVSAFTSANIDKILRSDLVQPARARGPRSVLWMWCTGAPWSVRQELARVWCDHLPAAPLRNPEGGSLCYSRSAAIAMISIFSACAFCRSCTSAETFIASLL